MQSNEAEAELTHFIDQCSAEATTNEFPRMRCASCNSSRCMYCFDCFQILIPPQQWPEALHDGTLRLPFDVDIILDDRRSSATGVQLKTILASVNEKEVVSRRRCLCRLYDIGLNEAIPSYSTPEDDGTFLLFPGSGSQPFSSIVASCGASPVKRLVVLDCKWSKLSIRFHPSIAALPRVYLDCVPKHSFYWRWHTAGDGMLSTVEAIFYSAWVVATVRQDFTLDERAKLVNLLWLFGLQREIIKLRYKDGKVKHFKHNPSAPFLEASKEFSRSLRRKQKTQESKGI